MRQADGRLLENAASARSASDRRHLDHLAGRGIQQLHGRTCRRNQRSKRDRWALNIAPLPRDLETKLRRLDSAGSTGAAPSSSSFDGNSIRRILSATTSKPGSPATFEPLKLAPFCFNRHRPAGVISRHRLSKISGHLGTVRRKDTNGDDRRHQRLDGRNHVSAAVITGRPCHRF